MASISITVGEQWEGFIQKQVKSGRYASTSEVVCAALRELETKLTALEALRNHLAPGAAQSMSSDFVSSWSPQHSVDRAILKRGSSLCFYQSNFCFFIVFTIFEIFFPVFSIG